MGDFSNFATSINLSLCRLGGGGTRMCVCVDQGLQRMSKTDSEEGVEYFFFYKRTA